MILIRNPNYEYDEKYNYNYLIAVILIFLDDINLNWNTNKKYTTYKKNKYQKDVSPTKSFNFYLKYFLIFFRNKRDNINLTPGALYYAIDH